MVHGQYIIIALQTQDFGKESRFFLKGSRFYLYRYRRKPVYNKLTNETEEQHRFQKKMEDMKMKKKFKFVKNFLEIIVGGVAIPDVTG